MNYSVIAVILLQLLHVGVPAPSTFADQEHLLDINHQPLDLRLDTIYSIHNSATGLPLLHDRPGTNVTRPSHWWTLTPLNDNIYYLQIQEIKANASAPRWDRRVRLELASSPGVYHLRPVSCFKYKNQKNAMSDSYLYVDYFDENGRDNSECVSSDAIRNGWNTKLEEKNIANRPTDILTRKNFEYKFTTLNVGLETRLQESGNVMSLATAPSTGELLLPKLNFHEENANNLDIGKPKGTIPYDCQCKETFKIERPYFTFSIPSNSKFRLNIGNQPDSSESESSVTISGWMGDTIENNAELKYSTWTLKWKDEAEEFTKVIPTSLSIISMNGLQINSDQFNRSRNFVYYHKTRNAFGFYWTSSSSRPQMQLRIGPSEENDLCICHLPMYWNIHPLNVMGGLIFMVFATVLIYTRVARSRNNGLRNANQLTNSQQSPSPHICKFKNKVGTILGQCGISSGSGCGNNGSKEKKLMLQNI